MQDRPRRPQPSAKYLRARRAADSSVKISDLQEGDLLLFKGIGASGQVIGFFSNGISHVATILSFDGKLWLCQATLSDKGETLPYLTPPGNEEAFQTGVHGAGLQETLDTGYYSVAAAVRPSPALTETELEQMRARFVELYGRPYETADGRLVGLGEMANSYLGLPRCLCSCGKAREAWFCSELVAELYRVVGRLPKETGAETYLPNELLRVRHDRLGPLEGFADIDYSVPSSAGACVIM